MRKLNRILLIIAILAGISYVGYLIEGNGKMDKSEEPSYKCSKR